MQSIWIYIELFLIIKYAITLSYDSSDEEKIVIKQKWDKCCIKNICENNSCYFVIRRSSTWAATRQRCQSIYPDYPSLIDLTQIRNEYDLEILSNMTLRKAESAEQRKIWTSGISCPKGKDGTDGQMTKWTNSDSPFQEWLQNRIRYNYLSNSGCTFLAFTPANTVSDIELEFEDQRSHHLGMCEFLLPEDILNITFPGTTTSSRTTTAMLTSPKVKSKTLGPGFYKSTKEVTTISTSSPTTTNTNNTQFCNGTREAEIDWPPTAAGATANESCPEGMTGYAQWFCNATNLKFTPPKPDIQECSHVWIKDLEDNVDDGKDAVDISAKLAEETKKQNMSHGDITALVKLSTKIMHLFSTQIKYTRENKSYVFTHSMVSSMSNILRDETKDAWSVLPVNHQTRAASKILQIVTIIGSHLSCIKRNSEGQLQFTVQAQNIDLQTFIMNEEKEADQIVFPQKVKGIDSSLIVPANLNWRRPYLVCNDYNTAVGVLYRRVGDFLKEENDTERKVVTQVISFSLNNDTKSLILPEGKLVTIVLRHNLNDDKRRLFCMFWNFSKSKYGKWDDSGCSFISSNQTHVTCSCNHLTNFAVLMDVNNNVKEDDILSLMTYVCCGMSSLSLVITLICFLSIRSLHGRRGIITGNLCLALLITNLLILFGLDKTGNKTLCAIIAAFLHFWILSAFSWMLVEGYHLYKMVVLVFERGNQLSVKAYYCFAYGMPLIIVGISFGIKTDFYGGDTYCWLSSEDGLMWSFVGPACAVILINIVVFILTLRSASSVRIKREQTTLKKIKNWARGSMSVMCLLGLTWCLGLFYIDRKLQVFSYIFTIFNGLQGVFIFLFHVLLNEKVLNWSGNKSCWKKYSQQTSSNQLHSKLSTRTSVNSLGCASMAHTRQPSNLTPHRKSSRENINAYRAKIKGKKNWNSENFKSKEKATHTVSENGISNFHPQRRYKTRSQSFPEDAHDYNNIEYITRNNNNRTSVRNCLQ
ncbi:adhesion G protein-coupled receptor L1 isoform X1 [Parasteatoda tepidariorum]|uniref:adhesion G protein-coupled receptor L1 isoform X1 n=2 Tax=Parasteatoda tepidariorum TaxID=114398 RepID=UPI001C71C33E|nr:adhesion G protein-coupled receptor L1 isoform X1 [Parasteatoda tepidariorum]